MKTKLTSDKRYELIQKALKGEPLKLLCQEYGISTALFNRLLRRYEQYGKKGLIAGKPGRKRKSRVPKKIEFRPLSPHERLRIVENIINEGESVSDVARQYQTSRNTIYKWLKRYRESNKEKISAFEDKIPEVRRYYRQSPALYQDAVLSLVAKHPEFGVRKIVSNLPQIGAKPILGHHGVQNILRRQDLSTYEQRLVYSQAKETPVIRGISDLLTYVARFFALPYESRRKVIQIFYTFAFSAITTIFILGLGNYIATSFSKIPDVNPIGYFFATIALVMGGLFFLYSMKYFLTLALVLSYSQTEAKGERQDLGGKRNGFLSWILGLGNGNNNGIYPNARLSLENGKSGVSGLEPNLSHIKLDRYPFISVHIPLYNEKYVAERVAKAVTNFEYGSTHSPQDYEVILCDDSTDETTAIIRNYMAKHLAKGEHLHTIVNKEEGWELSKVEVRAGVTLKHLHRTTRQGFKGGALKLALTLCDPRTEFVSIFDADFVPYPDTLELFLKYFKATAGTLDFAQDKVALRQSNIAAVQGYQWHVLNKSENWITRGVRSEYAGSYVIERSGQEIYGGLKHISGAVYLIRKDVLDEVGWETSITEDYELTLKLYEKGYKVVYTPYIQAPAECVSTLKRLIRQRMRWAEGHSHNVRKMFGRLMFGRWEEIGTNNPAFANDRITNYSNYSKQAPSTNDKIGKLGIGNSLDQLEIRNLQKKFIPSPLTLSEKLEFAYNAPYYLQAFFFLIGTISWLISETIFKTSLPFWSQLWGWSLVLTNMLALPLMNSVGLFLEESEEKDYGGILSFIVLSYIVVPFQAYASVKGFLEHEEGTWFRTPKTGRITDIFTRGRFYRFISGILPRRAEQVVNSQLSVATNYISLATANNRFDKGDMISSNKTKIRWVGKVTFVFSLIATLITYQTVILDYQGRLEGPANILNGRQASLSSSKKVFSSAENPRFTLSLKNKKVKSTSIFRRSTIYAAQKDSIDVDVYYLDRRADLPVEIKRKDDNIYDIEIGNKDNLSPGVYNLVVKGTTLGDEFEVEKKFSWGVLAFNTTKSVYEPGERIKMGVGVVDDAGRTICDAKVNLFITVPSEGKTYELSTNNGLLRQSGECLRDSITNKADYEAEFTARSVEETYSVLLEAESYNGKKSVEESIVIRDNLPFIVERVSYPTRIYPPVSYPVKLKIVANQDFEGSIIESFPNSEFVVYEVGEGGERKENKIVWKVNLRKGETYELDYTLGFPMISPAFYLIGPLTFVESEKMIFREEKPWQVAADSITFQELDSGVIESSTATITSVTTATNSTAVNNHLYLAVVTTKGNRSVDSVSGLGLSWSLVDSQCGDRQQTNLAVFKALGSPSGDGAVTANLNGGTAYSGGATIGVYRYSGVDIASPIGNTEKANTGGVGASAGVCDTTGTDTNSYSFSTLDTSQANSMVFSAASNRTRTHTEGTNYNERGDFRTGSSGDSAAQAVQDQIFASQTTNLTVDGTWSGVVDWAVVAIEIKTPENLLLLTLLSPVLFIKLKSIKKRKKGLKKSKKD